SFLTCPSLRALPYVPFLTRSSVRVLRACPPYTSSYTPSVHAPARPSVCTPPYAPQGSRPPEPQTAQILRWPRRMIADLWYRNAIIYSLDVETFLDADGDGVGDFE